MIENANDTEATEVSRPAGNFWWKETEVLVINTYGTEHEFDSVEAIVEAIFTNSELFEFANADEILKVEEVTEYRIDNLGHRSAWDYALRVTWTYGDNVIDEDDNETDELNTQQTYIQWKTKNIYIGSVDK